MYIHVVGDTAAWRQHRADFGPRIGNYTPQRIKTYTPSRLIEKEKLRYTSVQKRRLRDKWPSCTNLGSVFPFYKDNSSGRVNSRSSKQHKGAWSCRPRVELRHLGIALNEYPQLYWKCSYTLWRHVYVRTVCDEQRNRFRVKMVLLWVTWIRTTTTMHSVGQAARSIASTCRERSHMDPNLRSSPFSNCSIPSPPFRTKTDKCTVSRVHCKNSFNRSLIDSEIEKLLCTDDVSSLWSLR